MSELTATTSRATPEGVVTALVQLTVAYFDSQSVGDWARASIALRVFADVFNEHRGGVIRAVTEFSRDPGAVRLVPASADAGFSGTTRRAMQVVLLVSSAHPQMDAVAESMPETALPVQLQAWYDGALRPILAAADLELARELARASVASAGTTLPARADVLIYGSATSVPLTPVLPPAGTSTNPVVLPDFPVTPTRWVMPTWGWWALGTGLVVGLGVVGYGVVERGWFRR